MKWDKGEKVSSLVVFDVVCIIVQNKILIGKIINMNPHLISKTQKFEEHKNYDY